MSRPEFVRELWAGEPVVEPLALSAEDKVALQVELDVLRRSRDRALISGQNYIVGGAA